MTRYYQRVKTQHQNMVAIMQRSYQISLMLYSQKEDYTFDLSYACHEATEQYRDFKFNRMPFDKITERLENEITRYNSLIETLENLPPNKKMSQKVVEKIKNSPFMLSEKNQRFRDECVEMATKLRDNLLEMKNGIEKDKQYYTRIEKRLKKVNDYAVKRYGDIQRSIFINGGDSYFTVLKSLKRSYNEAKTDATEKYRSETIDTADGNKVSINSQWRGPIVLFLAMFILFYLSIAAALSGAIMKWIVPKKLRTEEFMKKKVCIMLMAAIVIFVIAAVWVHIVMKKRNAQRKPKQ